MRIWGTSAAIAVTCRRSAEDLAQAHCTLSCHAVEQPFGEGVALSSIVVACSVGEMIEQ